MGGTASLTDRTISGNVADSEGGGFYNGRYTTLSETNCTMSGNSASANGGGALNNFYHGKVFLTNTIVAGNTGPGNAPSDITFSLFLGRRTPIRGQYNFIGPGGSGGIHGGGGNIIMTNLAKLDLGPLANNGGPTQTMALLPGSAAIHAGITVTGHTTDQRFSPIDSPPDIGAYQT